MQIQAPEDAAVPFRSTRQTCHTLRVVTVAAVLAGCAALAGLWTRASAQTTAPQNTLQNTRISEPAIASRRARAFTRGRTGPPAQGSPQGATALMAAHAQHLRLAASPQAASLNTAWTPAGPVQVQSSTYGLITGRVTAAAIDPSDASGNTVYIGTSGGGVWKSTNAAGTASAVQFKPLTDTLPVFSASAGTSALPSLSIGAISVQPGSTGVILAGTGDPNDATDSYYGSGLLRSADGGLTWSLIPYALDTGGLHSFVGQGFAGFAWSTSSPQLVVAAVSSSAESDIVGDDAAPGVRGLYYSTDGGVTWNLATLQDGSTVIQNQSTSFTTFRGNAATAVVWNPVRKRFYAAVRFHGYYESTDGMTWTRLTNQPGAGLTATNCPARAGDYGAQACLIFRGALAAQPASGDLFALTVDAANKDQGLWQDTCAFSGSACTFATVTWATQLAATPMETAGIIPQGDYNLSLAAIPAATALSMNDTLLFAGAADLYRCSLTGGCTLRNTTNTSNGCAAPAGVAPAQHAIAWQANLSNTSTPLLYIGNDGGLWRSTDGVRQQAAPCSPDDATHFDNLNGALGSLAEVSSLSSHPTDATILLAALGANGSAASTSSAQATNQSPWTQLSPAESGTVAIDQGNGSTWLVQSGAGVALHTCSSGTACTASDLAGSAAVGLTQVSNDVSRVDPPALLDPVLNTNLITGTCRVWRGPTSGNTAWSASNAISPFLAGPAATACTSTDATIRSLAAGGAVQLTNASQTSGSPVLYAGLSGSADSGKTFGGHIFGTTTGNIANSTTPWSDLATSPVTNDPSGFNPGGFDISGIAVDPNDATGHTVYATILGFGYPHVYRSTNAGATWTNISANLPNAPANAVAVDPYNAGIVYVAMDTGVYVTTDVTGCISVSGATVNCWSVMGTALPNAPVLSLVASRSIAVPGSSVSGVLRAGTYGRGIWQQPLLSAGTSSLPAAGFSPSMLTFNTQVVGTTSASKTATLTNTGNAAMVIATVAASSGFVETDTCANTTLAAGASCSIVVSYAPTATGPVTGSVQVVANVNGGYASLALSGTGAGGANVTLSPSSLTFASTAVGTASSAQSITVNNSGSAAIMLGTPVLTGDFALSSSTCGSSIAASASCTVSVLFKPTAAGPRSGTLSLTDAYATHTVVLSGSGVAGVISLSAGTLTFADTAVNATSPAQTLTVTNTGSGALTIASLIAAGDFAAAGTCSGVALDPGKTCTVSLTFTPTAVGTRNGTLTLTSNSGGASTQTTVALSGNGKGAVYVVLTPLSVDFGTQITGTLSNPTNITISNTGTASGAIQSINVSGDFILKADTCGASLAAQTGCTVSIVFAPSTAGARTGTLTVVDDAGTQTAALTGTGTAAATDTLSPLSLTFAAQQVNTTSAAQTVTLTNTGDTPLTLVATQVLTGDFTVVNNCGATLTAHNTCGITVMFVPKSIGTLTGTLQVSDVLHIQTVTLSGASIAGPGVSLLPSSLTFADTGVGVASAGQTLTLTNNGGSPLQLSAINLTGDYGIVSGSSTCSLSLAIAPAGNCSLQIAFVPAAAGGRTGTVTVLSNAATQSAQLTGAGVDFALVANGPTSLTVATGASAAFSLLMRPVATTADPVTYACTGVPANSKCTVVAQYGDLSAISTVTVTVLTGATAAARPIGVAALVLPLLLGLPFWPPRRRLRGSLWVMLALTLVGITSCGAPRVTATPGDGSAGGGGTSPVTPSGTYTISVTATAAGVTRTLPLTLIVQ